ncbi:MAG: nickel-dependent hydrogenase large subunit [Barnesiella sp.]|nr:nickel-dependent hydrogenase large subunit [Barnesiella sp.]MBD5330341.1 nickel-dependent hydrogenase large subunit [Bacteroides sp.]MBD5331818.1 nickel-dependent hydrogenase large subunit [Bacteroides sp.]MDE7460019.1 nickel-dependent hydrogenase large subunit [Paramuribaculum sp.]
MEIKVVVDPVTRIEGHLRMEAVVRDGVITEAYSTGTMVRGIEIIVKDRDPRDVWAFVMRVCGVCTSMHGLASVRSIENALGIEIPYNAEMVRNIMLATLQSRDHLVHFYQLDALDWVDIVAALKADPAEASRIAQSLSPLNSSYSPWGENSPGYFSDVQRRVKKFVEANPKNNLFSTNRWCWGSKLYKLPPEVSLIGLAHYLQALEFQKEICKIQTIFGGKSPHPNYLVGGMACAINMQDPNAINMARLAFVKEIAEQVSRFANEVFLPDCLAIMAFYPEWAHIGGGLHNYLSYGDYPMNHYGDFGNCLQKQGIVMNRDLSHVEPFDAKRLDGLQEFVNNAWYKYSVGKDKGLHPSIGETVFDYTGPTSQFDWLPGDQPYSWIKTPRYMGHPMEVGPLARLAVNYASGNDMTIDITDRAVKQWSALTDKFNSRACGIDRNSLFSTAGRIIARAVDAVEAAEYMSICYNKLIDNIKAGDETMFNGSKWQPSTWPSDCMGFSLNEAPRGALAHYSHITHGKIANYQMVVPTTWNASPRDPANLRSAFEESIIGTPVAGFAPDSPEMALSIIRTLHSFDPCMACAVHLYDENGTVVHKIDINAQ